MQDERDKEKNFPWYFRSVKAIIKKGKHPTNNALVAALRGKDRMPRIVRDYLADRIEKGWPQGGRTPTQFENIFKLELQKSDGGFALSEFVRRELIEDASIEVGCRQACYHVFRFINNGMKPRDAINKLVSKKRKPKWLKFFIEAGPSEIFDYYYRNDRTYLTKKANMSLDDIIEEVAEEKGISFEALERFHKVYRYRNKNP